MSTSSKKMIYGYYPEKRYTRAPQYIEDMVNDLKRISSSCLELHNAESVWAIKDRALGAMCVFSPREIAAIVEEFPILYRFMEFREKDSPHINFSFDITLSPHYKPLKALVAIATSADEALRAYARYDFLPESILNLMAEQINIINKCIPQYFTLEPKTTKQAPTPDIANFNITPDHIHISAEDKNKLPAKLNPFVPEWFKLLCSINKIDFDLPASKIWNVLKTNFTPQTPLKAGTFQTVIHEKNLYYSDVALTEKEWLKYFSSKNAKRITYKTFTNYISSIKNSQSPPKEH
ncbi:hypothetical protein SAMN05660337_1863 [Maridesulfovibrio ferrireducens]|uniref:Uncharacterized protein n=1 Tax=Maridesulfovibrio ferrireducens TaxID=246191 RepID=A0A1G9G773_9BACT|nr:hypothetical protein [Maridesulfovibrio ferrireducens]SDK96461.1 hypothetical protein SAMN05660337_1863 [Maridesulfovibrio ferrireducens]